jgi:hypothetical protein
VGYDSFVCLIYSSGHLFHGDLLSYGFKVYVLIGCTL